MPKRPLSPAPLPLAKRLHVASNADGTHSSNFPVFDGLYDELILYIFSYLSFVDVCAAQATNRNWSRLATDNHLWKALYVNAYGRSRLRGARGFLGRMDGREVKPLPIRVQSLGPGALRQTEDEDRRDWKWMFRISSNWRRGRCNIERFSEPSPSVPVDLSSTSTHEPGHVLLAGPLSIVSSLNSTRPAIRLYKRTGYGRSDLDCPPVELRCTTQLGGPASVMTLALDQAAPSSPKSPLRLAVCLSTGEFNIFNIDHNNASNSSQALAYVPSRRSVIIQAAYHHPLLITLSQTLRLSIFDLSQDSVTLVQTLTTCTSYPPTSFVLSNPTPTTYKLVMVFTVPVYPSHWSIAATELVIAGYSDKPNSISLLPPSPSLSVDSFAEPMTVTTSRTVRALDVPQGWIDEQKLRAMREQWSRKVNFVAQTQTDGKWVILAPGADPTVANVGEAQSSFASPAVNSPTTLQLYRLHFPTTSPRTGRPSLQSPKLTFVRYLHGQTSPVCALALADGRCVSLGTNGCIWVWDLENGTGAEVAPPLPHAESHAMESGAVVFDDRRIVTTHRDGIVIRRFDV
ncbi:hypothetical protein HGRIS_002581 [Hohenbuehelia grisea]|uniref:F-box domain-containing protein n=1 Tax=Hohenbuehelia grisea TaxID=104357 RepID=A0ABR3JKX8_9AGAR